MEGLAPSTINVRLSAVRKLVEESRRNGSLSAEAAANLSDIPNVRQQGTRLGNWLTKEQARELLTIPDRSIVKGKRDYVILALLVGCALRREELATLEVETVQLREGRWVLADLEGREDASGPWPSRCGSSRRSMPGWPRPGSRRAGCFAMCSRAAKASGIGLRTTERARYHDSGLAGLVRRPRNDCGRRKVPAEVTQVIEGLFLTKPRPSVAAIHRRLLTISKERQCLCSLMAPFTQSSLSLIQR